MVESTLLTVGEAARRSGVRTSTLRFYESKGLIESLRTPGNQRRYPRSTLRRISVIRAAQSFGLSLEEIGQALATLPDGRVPTKQDWSRLSKAWRGRLDERIAQLLRLRDSVDQCIGCGCLSLASCALMNLRDVAAEFGSGPRYLLGDRPGGRRPEDR